MVGSDSWRCRKSRESIRRSLRDTPATKRFATVGLGMTSKEWKPPGSRGGASKDTGGNVPFSSVEFPNLHAGNHQLTSPADNRYNCIAWAAGIDSAWWEPVIPRHWPANVPRNYKVSSLILAYESVGYVICADNSHEE